MDWFAKAFIRAALVWLGFGVTLGLVMVLSPGATAYRTAHLHMNLLGFVSMMIYGFAYHVIPRFTGSSLHSRGLASTHWWVANSGLALLVTGFGMRAHGDTGAAMPLGIGGLATAASAYLFIYNIWRTMDGKAKYAPATPGRNTARRHLPTAP